MIYKCKCAMRGCQECEPIPREEDVETIRAALERLKELLADSLSDNSIAYEAEEALDRIA